MRRQTRLRGAVAFHPEQIATKNGKSRLMVAPMFIAESSVPTARAQGWIVLGLDSEVYPVADIDVNVQSNPRRPTHGAREDA